MALYDLNAIPENSRLKFNRQYQLTATCTFKILETGVAYHNSREQFVVRLTRNTYTNGRHFIIYTDITKENFDQIIMQARRIRKLLQRRSNDTTVYQNPSIHVWTQRPCENGPMCNGPTMLCVCGSNGRRIYIVERTFIQMMELKNFIDEDYDRFNEYFCKRYNGYSDYYSDDNYYN